MKGILGTKLGMTQIFDGEARVVPVTVIQAGPCVVTAMRTVEKNGYGALQIGYKPVDAKKLTKPAAGQFAKSGVAPHRYLRELRGAEADGYTLGQTLTVEQFAEGERVDVIGVSKGKGFAGTMKRHNFSGGPKSHGSMTHRQPASSGSTDAARTYKGTRKPGRLGGVRRTSLGLSVVKVDQARSLLLVKGNVPGPPNGLVFVRQSVKPVRAPKAAPKAEKQTGVKKK